MHGAQSGAGHMLSLCPCQSCIWKTCQRGSGVPEPGPEAGRSCLSMHSPDPKPTRALKAPHTLAGPAAGLQCGCRFMHGGCYELPSRAYK